MRERRVRPATLVRMSATTRHILAAPAWPYANGPRHIGHVSGFALPCDMFSRYQRMAGNRVLMVSGTRFPAIRWYRLNMSQGSAKPETWPMWRGPLA